MSNLPRLALRPAGFTIIELIVAISITALMLFLVNRIFNDTNRAVSRGIELSEVISQERALQKHLQNDIAAMMGPQGAPGTAAISGDEANGGPLVIVQHAVLNRTFDLPNSPTVDVAVRDVRADQLMFVRTRSDEQLIGPTGSSGFTPPTIDDGTPYARVWYGHLLRANDDGGDPGLTIDLDNAVNFLDTRPTSWLLGRQALFLSNIQNGAGVSPPSAVSGAHTNGAWIDAPTTTLNIPGFTDPPLYMGVTDNAYASLYQGDQPGGGRGSLISDVQAASNTPTRVMAADQNVATYQDRAVANFTFARTRLRANDRPPSADYTAAEVAQMHPTIAEGVSDFIVEFAADTDNDEVIDRVTSAESNAIATALGLADPNAFTGTIKWYTHDAYVNRPNAGPPLGASPGSAAYDDTKPLTFELPAGAFKANVYVADINATLSSAPFEAGTAAFVWRHDRYEPGATAAAPPGNAFCDWPYLLRIRYRMHDPQGDLASAEGQHGVWFEQVLKVNRPYP